MSVGVVIHRGRASNLKTGLPVGARLCTPAQELRHVVLLALVGRLQGRPAHIALAVPSVGSGPAAHPEPEAVVVLWQPDQPEDRTAALVAAIRG